MNKLALILGLSLSLSVHAFEPIGEDELLVIGTADGGTQYLTFSELTERIEEQNPILMEWCRQKANVARAVHYDRERQTHDEAMAELKPIQPKMKHYMWLEIQRMTADIYRYNAQGGWNIPGSLEVRKTLHKKEYQTCVVNGF